ncbi:MAG: alanyl-tRNA editing protein [Thermoplasmata archaeon]
MARELYMENAYLREFESSVLDDRGDRLVLATTAFYPTGGGQPCDTGVLRSTDGRSSKVIEVAKGPTGIEHVLEGTSFPRGAIVGGQIDWDRRYSHMRYHTALHILSGVVFHQFGSGITGGQISQDRARMDFSLPDFNRTLAEDLIATANAVVAEDRPIHVRFLTRETALQDPTLVRVAQELMPEVSEVRLIDIAGFDVQADGGTHVKSTREVGTLELERIENKGARNKRLTLRLGPPPAPR